MSDAQEPNAEKMPETGQLAEPSTEKDPGEEPKDPEPEVEEVDHQAEGIGVIGSSDGGGNSPDDASAQGVQPDPAPPTEAASDDVKRDASGVDEAPA
jgi:hypothetical protein